MRALLYGLICILAAGCSHGPAGQGSVEAGILSQVNAERAAQGLAPLRETPQLHALAVAYSRRMAEEHFFSHYDARGAGALERATAAGIRVGGIAENIARIERPRDPATQAVRGWMDSPGHRANILEGRFTETGVGAWWDGKTCYFTQEFTAPE